VRTIGNVLWFVLAGVWLAIGYAIAGVLLCITVIGIPFGLAAFRLAGYVIWPFGRIVVRNPDRVPGVSAVANVLWFVLAGWWLCLIHLVTGFLLCLTIIAIPFGIANFKLAGLALAPLGKLIVPADLATRPGLAGGKTES
jgi:uncharacterized membrane protein YccF (DUF307 family)